MPHGVVSGRCDLWLRFTSRKLHSRHHRPPTESECFRQAAIVQAGERQYSALKSLIVDAYEVRYEQVIGPDWLNSENYDLIATLPAGSSRTQVPLMLQALL